MPCGLVILGWQVRVTRRRLTQPLKPALVAESLHNLGTGQDEHGVLDGEARLLDPWCRYDVELHRLFAGPLSVKRWPPARVDGMDHL